MDYCASPRPVIVGIDGSKHAVRAAIWAIDEALSRDTPLRLVHVINGHSRHRDRGYAYAGHILHKACVAVASVGKSVIVDSDVFEGDPAAELVEASRGAALLCLGSQGTNNSPWRERGSTASELTRRAHSPVAIIGRQGPRRARQLHRTGRGTQVPSARDLRPFHRVGPGRTVVSWST